MLPTHPEPAEAAPSAAQPLSAEAAWGMRAAIMVLMVLLRWFGAGSTRTDAPDVDPTAALPPDATPGVPASDDHRAARAERVARSLPRDPSAPTPVTVPATAPAATTAANRRRAVYASALTAAGTAAWVAGRRSGRRQ